VRAASGSIAQAFALIVLSATGLFPQDSTTRAPTPGRVRGRVVADSGGTPIVDAEVQIAAIGRRVRTDSLGRYDLPNLPSGSVLVLVRAIGFRAESTAVDVRERRVVNLEMRLAFDDIAVTRPGAARAAPAITRIEQANPAADPNAKTMAEFYKRQALGVGRFLDSVDVGKWAGHRTAEILDDVGGLKIENKGLQAFATNGRVPASTCLVCRVVVADTLDPAIALPVGARPPCYMDIYVDGVAVYQFGVEPPLQLFDLNGVPPESIQGIEVYTGAAQTPAKYGNRFGSGCGAILIWTRVPRPETP